jgi:hypothetical protein
MKRLITLLFLGLLALGPQSFAQDFPLSAHVKRIGQDQKLNEGTTETWHLVVAEIDGHAYGLEVYRTSFRRLDWLHVGDYPCRRTKHGFEFQYQDGGKTHTREFNIVSEE